MCDFKSSLHEYFLTSSQMVKLGYPVERNGAVYIYRSKPKVDRFDNRPRGNFETINHEFVPYRRRSDSCSSVPRPMEYLHAKRHNCNRCNKVFHTLHQSYLTFEECYHHPGRVVFNNQRRVHLYSCCGRWPGTGGCRVHPFHVWSGVGVGVNGPFDGYVKTKSSLYRGIDAVYALDCEMSYTVTGLELTRVTVINANRELVYETHVLPDNPILDFNTEFSGVTQAHMLYAKSLREVQADLLRFMNDRTVLIGHGLDNDLRALKLLHGRVVDTAYLFPHHKGLPFRRSLKSLALSLLNREIRTGLYGHCSYEDATTCLDLMVWKVRQDFLLCT